MPRASVLTDARETPEQAREPLPEQFSQQTVRGPAQQQARKQAPEPTLRVSR
ncbi:hypothetical protein AA0473_1358 [Acetobacter orleanensis NRIC 0473]|nr:hypothetical protein AA0473_1358 [Acetobacter orleanensis NRIC 0473]